MDNKLLQPLSMTELTQALGQPGRKMMVAGGTDLMIRLRSNPPQQVTLIDLSHVDALRHMERTEEGLRIGAMCTMSALSESPLLHAHAKILACAASQVGSTQIRNRATLGGNVANAAQCADTIPPLIALEASVALMNSRGELRSIKVEDFVTGIGRTQIADTEVITAILIPGHNLSLKGGYAKVGAREAVTIAKVNCAGLFSFSEEESSVLHARVAFGSLGHKGFYSSLVSEGMTGMTLKDLSSGAYLELFVSQVEQAIPGRASLTYKRSAVKAVAASVVEQAMAEVRGRSHGQ